MTDLGYATITCNLETLTGGSGTKTAVTGQVTIYCDAHLAGKKALIMVPATDESLVIQPTPMTLVDGAASISYIATGQTGVTVPDDFTLHAEFDLYDANGAPISLPPLTFRAPAGVTTDLSTVPPVTPSAGTVSGVTLAQVQALLGTYVPIPDGGLDDQVLTKSGSTIVWAAVSVNGSSLTDNGDGTVTLVTA